MAYTTELMSFAVRVGKEDRADEWMRTLAERQVECNATLDREAMHLESVFKSVIDDRVYLSWFSIQGSTREHPESSPFPIDKVHMDFWNECIDSDVMPIRFRHMVSFLPVSVADAIACRDAGFAKDAC